MRPCVWLLCDALLASSEWHSRHLCDVTSVILPREADNVDKWGKGKAGTTTYFANQYLSSPEILAKVAKKRAETKQYGSSLECKKFFTVGEMSVLILH